MMHYPVLGWAAGLGWLIGLLFLVGLILVVVWVVNTLTRNGRGPRDDFGGAPGRSSANEILRERFARGEITEEQFEQMRKVLGPDR